MERHRGIHRHRPARYALAVVVLGGLVGVGFGGVPALADDPPPTTTTTSVDTTPSPTVTVPIPAPDPAPVVTSRPKVTPKPKATPKTAPTAHQASTTRAVVQSAGPTASSAPARPRTTPAAATTAHTASSPEKVVHPKVQPVAKAHKKPSVGRVLQPVRATPAAAKPNPKPTEAAAAPDRGKQRSPLFFVLLGVLGLVVAGLAVTAVRVGVLRRHPLPEQFANRRVDFASIVASVFVAAGLGFLISHI
jgi:hypothetical protein